MSRLSFSVCEFIPCLFSLFDWLMFLPAVNYFDDGTETRTCIDGKQRLTSIHRYVVAGSLGLYESLTALQVHGWFGEL